MACMKNSAIKNNKRYLLDLFFLLFFFCVHAYASEKDVEFKADNQSNISIPYTTHYVDTLGDVDFNSALITIRSAVKSPAPKCFICRAWEEDENHPHNVFAIKLKEDLEKAGIDARIDICHLLTGESITEYIQQITNDDVFVITLFTPAFGQRVSKKTGWLYQECCLIEERLDKGNSFFYLPVLLAGDFKVSIPDTLNPADRLYKDVKWDVNYNKNLLALLREKLLKPELLSITVEEDLSLTKLKEKATLCDKNALKIIADMYASGKADIEFQSAKGWINSLTVASGYLQTLAALDEQDQYLDSNRHLAELIDCAKRLNGSTFLRKLKINEGNGAGFSPNHPLFISIARFADQMMRFRHLEDMGIYIAVQLLKIPQPNMQSSIIAQKMLKLVSSEEFIDDAGNIEEGVISNAESMLMRFAKAVELYVQPCQLKALTEIPEKLAVDLEMIEDPRLYFYECSSDQSRASSSNVSIETELEETLESKIAVALSKLREQLIEKLIVETGEEKRRTFLFLKNRARDQVGLINNGEQFDESWYGSVKARYKKISSVVRDYIVYGDHRHIKPFESYSQPEVLVDFITYQFKASVGKIPIHILSDRLDETLRAFYINAEGITREGARALLYTFGYLMPEI